MIPAGLPDNEVDRRITLQGLGLLDTPPEERFDRITRLAKRLFGVPTALVSLVDEDRLWFKSRQGFAHSEVPRELSFCAHAIQGEGLMQVPDAEADPRFADNPFVVGDPNIRFYAGCPIAAPDGSKLGTLCVLDHMPRKLDSTDAQLLGELAELVEREVATVQLTLDDELTGLFNRRGFLMLADRVLAVCVRHGFPATLLFADLDAFKAVNDRFGHDEGDRAIQEAATVLKRAFRSSDVIARLGGDELCVVLSGAPTGKEAVARLGAALEERNAGEAARYQLAFSTGTAAFDPKAPVPLSDLMARADQEMYAQKDRKRRERGNAERPAPPARLHDDDRPRERQPLTP